MRVGAIDPESQGPSTLISNDETDNNVVNISIIVGLVVFFILLGAAYFLSKYIKNKAGDKKDNDFNDEENAQDH